MISLSPRLFRDVRMEDVDPERHAPWLAKRVLEYGDWPDWQELVRYCGKARLVGIVRKPDGPAHELQQLRGIGRRQLTISQKCAHIHVCEQPLNYLIACFAKPKHWPFRKG